MMQMASHMTCVVWALMLLLVFCFTPTNGREIGGNGGGCEDQVVMCGRWAATGWCQTRLQYMQENCPVSCNLCGDTACFDRSPYCGIWVLQWTCQMQEMQTTCPYSCNVCYTDEPLQSFTTRRETITKPEFECGRGRPPSGSTAGVSQKAAGGINAAVTPTTSENVKNIKARSEKITVEDIFCGATPITDRFLVTAAHCVIDPKYPVRTVRLGELDVAKDNEENSRPVDYEVKRIIVHYDFNPNSSVRYNDIALIETVEKIAFNDVVFPYCLPDARPPPQTLVTGAGFGYVNATHQSPILQEADMLVLTASECERQYKDNAYEWQRLREVYPKLLKDSDLMCAGFPGRGPCKGDEGGPLYLDKEGRRFLVGIASFTGTCGTETILPGVYLNVADHIDYIDSVIYPY